MGETLADFQTMARHFELTKGCECISPRAPSATLILPHKTCMLTDQASYDTLSSEREDIQGCMKVMTT